MFFLMIYFTTTLGVHRTNAQSDRSSTTPTRRQVRICCHESDRLTAIRWVTILFCIWAEKDCIFFFLYLDLFADTSELREPEKVRASQEKALQALQAYTLARYPESPAKFGELLLRIPELQRTCQVRAINWTKMKPYKCFNFSFCFSLGRQGDAYDKIKGRRRF